MKTRILSMVFIAVLAISTTAMAQQPTRSKRNPEQKEMMQSRAEMKNRAENFFSEEQQAKIKELRLETAKQIKPLRNELNELEARQQTLTTTNKADMGAINSNIDKMGKVKADIEKIRAKQHQEIRAMLSEEQLVKFDAMKGRMGHRGDMSERRRPEMFKGERPERGERPGGRMGD